MSKTDKQIAKVQKALDKLQNQNVKSNKLLAELEALYGKLMHALGNLYVKHTESVKDDIKRAEAFLKDHGRL